MTFASKGIMKKRLLAALTLALALAFSALPAMADHGDKDNKQGHGNKHDSDEGHGWEHRGDYEYRSYSPGGVPPGWSHGKKTGWGDCGLPPGQAKKYGCRTYSYQGRPYYYYQNDAGQIFVRRPTVEVHGSVDIH